MFISVCIKLFSIFFGTSISYVACHLFTVSIVNPIQAFFIPDLTAIASLAYLPHGVRVIATWAFGWLAVPGLFFGGFVSALCCLSEEVRIIVEPALMYDLLIGAFSALLVFELFRRIGLNFYAGRKYKISWLGLVLIAFCASLINSTGLTLIYAGSVSINEIWIVWLIFAIGDVVGLAVCLLFLMYIFRWTRYWANKN